MKNVRLLGFMLVACLLSGQAFGMKKKPPFRDEEKNRLYKKLLKETDKEKRHKILFGGDSIASGPGLLGEQNLGKMGEVILREDGDSISARIQKIINDEGFDGLMFLGRCDHTLLTGIIGKGTVKDLHYFLSFPVLKNIFLEANNSRVGLRLPLCFALKQEKVEHANALAEEGAKIDVPLLKRSVGDKGGKKSLNLFLLAQNLESQIKETNKRRKDGKYVDCRVICTDDN